MKFLNFLKKEIVLKIEPLALRYRVVTNKAEYVGSCTVWRVKVGPEEWKRAGTSKEMWLSDVIASYHITNIGH